MNEGKPTIAEVINLAQKDQWALGQFNLTKEDTIQAMVQAANESDSPVIIGVSISTLSNIGLNNLQDFIAEARKGSLTPLFFHLDRAPDLEVVKTVIDLGFDSAMIDPYGSRLEDKIETIRAAVAYGRERHVCIEAQIGEVQENPEADKILLPVLPEAAREFATRTGVDFLAISLDNPTKSFEEEVDVDIELIHEIASQSPVPIVVHGGASVPDKLIRETIQAGVVKINIDLAVRRAITSVFVAKYRSEGYITDPRQINKQVCEAVKKVVKQKMMLFGSAGKASSIL